MLADIDSNMHVSGAPDDRLDNDALHALGNIKASDFEVVKTNQEQLTCWRANNPLAGISFLPGS
jgi:hypothetical protein